MPYFILLYKLKVLYPQIRKCITFTWRRKIYSVFLN